VRWRRGTALVFLEVATIEHAGIAARAGIAWCWCTPARIDTDAAVAALAIAETGGYLDATRVAGVLPAAPVGHGLPAIVRAGIITVGRLASALRATLGLFIAEAILEFGTVAVETAPVLVVDGEVAVVGHVLLKGVAGDLNDDVRVSLAPGEVADRDLAGISLHGALGLHPTGTTAPLALAQARHHCAGEL
jgi:hypothetical protein